MDLGTLSRLSLHDRYSLIIETGRHDLQAALRALADHGAPVSHLTIDHVAWALAWNVAAGYLDHWPLDTRWDAIWTVMTRPRAGRPETRTPSASTLLAELTLSVACEHRPDWRPPLARPDNAAPATNATANAAFEWTYGRDAGRIIGYVRNTFGTRAGDPGSIAKEAWARVFCDYWSAQARRRFLGLSTISTLVCQVARHIAYDAVRRDAQFVAYDELPPDFNGDDRFVPHAEIAARELDRQVTACIAGLPARQRIVAHLVWVRQMRAKAVAQALHVSEPAVSQHLRKARARLRQHLRERGFAHSVAESSRAGA